MAILYSDLLKNFDSYVYKISLFSAVDPVAEMVHFGLRDIDSSEKNNCVIGFDNTEHVRLYLEEWLNEPSEPDGNSDLKNALIIGNSDSASPGLIRVGRLFNLRILPGSVSAKNDVLYGSFVYEKEETDYLAYLK